MKKYIFRSVIFFLMTIMPAYADSLKIQAWPHTTNFHIEDMAGRITGYTSSQILLQIPYIESYGDGMADDHDDPPKPHQLWREIYSSDSNAYIIPGKYKVVLYGDNITTMTTVIISIEMEWSNNNIRPIPYMRDAVGDYLFPGAVATYEFDIPASKLANNNFNWVKVAQPSDLIKDITIASNAGYIGNAEFVSEIIKKINKIEGKRIKPEKDKDNGLTPAQKAKKEYAELLNEITEKYNKPESDEFVKEAACNIIQEDIEYIINHIQ